MAMRPNITPVGPLPMPETDVGAAPKTSMGPTPLMSVGKLGSEAKTFKAVRPNRRLGAKKTNRMAFTPPQKKSAFSGK